MTSLSLKYLAWAEEERVCGISWVGGKTGWQVNLNCPQIFEQLEVLNKLWRWKNRLIASSNLRTLHSKRWRVLQIGRSRSILLSITAPRVAEQVSWFSDRPQGGILNRGAGSVVLGGKTGLDFGREIDACMGEGALERNLM